MYQRILIATEGSEFGGKALTHGLALAKALNVPVVVVTVTEAWSALELARMARVGDRNPIEHYEDMVTAAGNHILIHAADPEAAVGPHLAVVEAVGDGFVDRLGERLDRLGARIEQHDMMPQRDHQPAGAAESETADDLGEVPSGARPVLHRERVDALAGDVTEQQPACGRIPHR